MANAKLRKTKSGMPKKYKESSFDETRLVVKDTVASSSESSSLLSLLSLLHDYTEKINKYAVNLHETVCGTKLLVPDTGDPKLQPSEGLIKDTIRETMFRLDSIDNCLLGIGCYIGMSQDGKG